MQTEEQQKISKWKEEPERPSLDSLAEAESDSEKWRDFFKLFGIRDAIKIELLPSITAFDLKKNKHYSAYLKTECQSNAETSALYSKDNLKIDNFVTIPFFEFLESSVSYEKLFWDAILASWKKIISAGSPSINANGKKYVFRLSFLQCYLQNHPVIRSTGSKELHPSVELYSPKLQPFITQVSKQTTSIKIAKINQDLNDEQIDYFGFVKYLSGKNF